MTRVNCNFNESRGLYSLSDFGDFAMSSSCNLNSIGRLSGFSTFGKVPLPVISLKIKTFL